MSATIHCYDPGGDIDWDRSEALDHALAGARAQIRRLEGRGPAGEVFGVGFVFEVGEPQRWQQGEKVWDMVCARAVKKHAPPHGHVWDYWFALEDHPEWHA